MHKINRFIKEKLVLNIKGYILFVSIFFAGMALSFVLQISSGAEEEIKLYINDFLYNVNNYAVNPAETFKLSMLSNVKLVFFVFLMSLSVIGCAGTIVCTFFKGFSYGAVFCALSDTLGIKTVLIFLCVIAPHSIVSAVCFVIYFFYCFKNSLTICSGTNNLRKCIVLPAIYAMINIFILCFSALIQAYIEPFLLRLFNF